MIYIYNDTVAVVDDGDEARSSETAAFKTAGVVMTASGRLLKSRYTKVPPDPIIEDWDQFLVDRAVRQLSFLRSVAACGGQLSDKEDADVVALIRELRKMRKPG